MKKLLSRFGSETRVSFNSFRKFSYKALNGTFGKVNFKLENTPGLFGDYPGGIGGDSGMIRKRLKFPRDYRKILRGDSGGIVNFYGAINKIQLEGF